jgi:hypothetical protein
VLFNVNTVDISDEDLKKVIDVKKCNDCIGIEFDNFFIVNLCVLDKQKKFKATAMTQMQILDKDTNT